jgi:hypothetical protein
MTVKQGKIIDELKLAVNILRHALIDIKVENMDGQFDHCTSSELGNCVDSVVELSGQLDQIVNKQKGG